MIDDVAVIRSLPGMVVIEAADPVELSEALKVASEYVGPVYIRIIRSDLPEYEKTFMHENSKFEIGKAAILAPGNDITLICSGMMVSRCLEAADILRKEGVSAEVINVSTIKPIDADTILASAKKTRRIVTAENHSIIGGLGSAVAELLSESYPVIIRRVGVRDTFGQSAPDRILLDYYGLNTTSVVNAAKDVLSG
jgi:transketolase